MSAVPLRIGAWTSCSCPNPENTPVLPTWIVKVDFCVSMFRCWALAPSTHARLAARNTVRFISLTSQNWPLNLKPEAMDAWAPSKVRLHFALGCRVWERRKSQGPRQHQGDLTRE